MSEQKNSNRGYLYPNANKNKPTQPDFTGKLTVDGKEWKINAWENKSPEGKKFLSLSLLIPLQTSNTNNQTNTNTNANQNQETKEDKIKPSSNISEDFDLDAILKSTDEENPFN